MEGRSRSHEADEAQVRILLVTSWGTICGIAAHSEALIAAVQQADPSIEIEPSAAALDPRGLPQVPRAFDVCHLNYHRALHSRWTVDQVRSMRDSGTPVVITFHDTFGENSPDQLSQDLCDLADAFVVHEPCLGLEKAIYWRMGIPAFPLDVHFLAPNPARPVLGTIGFDFGWKSWERLADVTARNGWALSIFTPAMTPEHYAELTAINPHTSVHIGISTDKAIRGLHDCDATAFTNVCGNSGQSAAILVGLAARKPLIAFETCRQYRALLADDLGNRAITWCNSFEEVAVSLTTVNLGRFDTGIVALAEQESWGHLGQKYAHLFRGLIA